MVVKWSHGPVNGGPPRILVLLSSCGMDPAAEYPFARLIAQDDVFAAVEDIIHWTKRYGDASLLPVLHRIASSTTPDEVN